MVLLAEDNPDDVEIARRAFHRCRLGCDLVIARDGVEALAMLMAATRRPDLVLLDINLPKISGLQVLERLRGETFLAAIPVIVMSGSQREEDVQRSYELGANSYFQKPVVFDAFLESLGVLVRYWFEVATLPTPAREVKQ